MSQWPVILILIASFTLSAQTRGERFETIPFQTPSGRTIQATLMFPEASQRPQRKLPLVFLFGGFENAARVLTLVRPKAPLALVSFDYPFDPPRTKFRFPASLKHLPDAKQALHDTNEGILSLKELLKQRADLDPEKISIIGASLGAPFALLAGAQSTDFKAVVIVHGFADVPGVIRHQLMRRWRSTWLDPFATLFGHLGWWYLDLADPGEAAKKLRASQKVLMISATADSFIPPEDSARLRAALESSAAKKEFDTTEGDHLQPGSEVLIERLMERVTIWLQSESLL